MRSWTFVASRLAQIVVLGLVLTLLCFAALWSLPGDRALTVAVSRFGEALTPELVEQVRRTEGLDRGWWDQYAAWLGHLVTGDLGYSLTTHRPVVDEIATAWGRTLVLALPAWALGWALSLVLGTLAGRRPRGLVDRTTGAVSVALVSLPPFLVGFLTVLLFSFGLGWLPPAGFGEPRHVVLPVLTLALILAAPGTRVVRDAVVEVSNRFYVVYAAWKGLGARRAWWRHGPRNAAPPVITFAALQFASLLDGFLVVEALFAYPGMGSLLVQALIARNLPVVTGLVLVFGLSFAFVLLAGDVVAKLVEGRARRRS